MAKSTRQHQPIALRRAIDRRDAETQRNKPNDNDHALQRGRDVVVPFFVTAENGGAIGEGSADADEGYGVV